MKKGTVILLFLFSLMWFLNLCTPLIYDDYVYSFVWQDNAMGVALSEPANRVNSFTDLVYSQWKHYFSWGGRTVAHFLAQLFLWAGKDLFNLLNAGCFILLLLEIQWVINEGRISFNIVAKDILWTFGIIWIFTIYLGDIFTWLTLSCNYLWTTVIILAFILIFERYYLNAEDNCFERNRISSVLFFLFGLITGWTNENVPCFLILILSLYIFRLYVRTNKINWFLVSGLIGMVLGYILLVTAPGNYVRYARQVEDHIVTPGNSLVEENLHILANILLFRLVMIYYVLRSFIVIRQDKINLACQKLLNISRAFLFLSLASSTVMIFSPYFRYRSSFSGLIFLVISVGIVRRVRNLEGLGVQNKAERIANFERTIKKVICVITSAYISVTLSASLYIGSMQYQQTQSMLKEIEKDKQNPTNTVLAVRERPSWIDKNYFAATVLTGGHLAYPYSLSTDENCWINRDVARYYGIKSIRAEKEEALP